MEIPVTTWVEVAALLVKGRRALRAGDADHGPFPPSTLLAGHPNEIADRHREWLEAHEIAIGQALDLWCSRERWPRTVGEIRGVLDAMLSGAIEEASRHLLSETTATAGMDAPRFLMTTGDKARETVSKAWDEAAFARWATRIQAVEE